MKNLALALFAVPVATILASDAAVAYNLPLDYYVATLSVLGAIVVVLRTWTWARKEFKTEVREMITADRASHDEAHKRVDDKLDRLADMIGSLPCNRCEPRG